MPSGTSKLPGPLSREVAKVINASIPARGQAKVARAADVSAAQLNRVLNGEKVFKLEELDRVCLVLGLNVAEVIAKADKATRAERASLRSDEPEKLAPVIDGGFRQNTQPTDLQRAAMQDDGNDGADLQE